MILSGEKTEEYREIKDYWVNRLTWRHDEIDGIAWQEMIESLQDKEKFRYESHNEILETYLSEFAFFPTITFKNGYAKNAPTIVIECLGTDIGEAVPEWSDNWKGDVFRLKLGKIISTANLEILK